MQIMFGLFDTHTVLVSSAILYLQKGNSFQADTYAPLKWNIQKVV
jgi:hypothetical protein